jgi:hypothetical protein
LFLHSRNRCWAAQAKLSSLSSSSTEQELSSLLTPLGEEATITSSQYETMSLLSSDDPPIQPPNCTMVGMAASRKRRMNHHIGGDSYGGSGNSNQQLECFLWNLHVSIPPQSFSKDYIKVDIQDMVCSHFQIVNVESTYQPSSSSSSTSSTSSSLLHLKIGKLSATCHGRYHATGGLSGNVDAAVSQLQQQQQEDSTSSSKSHASSSAIQVVFQIIASTPTSAATSTKDSENIGHPQPLIAASPSSSRRPKEPKECKTQHCSTHLQAPWVRFSGSLSAKLIQVRKVRMPVDHGHCHTQKHNQPQRRR